MDHPGSVLRGLMSRKSLGCLSLFLAATFLISWFYLPSQKQVQAASGGPLLGIAAPVDVIGELFSQPVDPAGKLLISSWLDPDGSNNDKWVWDSFILPVTGGSTETITGIGWVGGYDPARSGAGGQVVDFSVEIYPSIPAGTEPAIANPPLVQAMTGGNAGQISIGDMGSIPMFAYSFSLPTPLVVTTGVKYWVQIEAFQHGSMPDWGIAKGTGGNASHYVRESGAGGDIIYHTVPEDAAFTILGLTPDIPTDISLAPVAVDENQPANTVVGTLTAQDPNPSATFAFSLGCAFPGVDDASFNISGSNLQTSAPFDFEAKNIYDICVRVTNQDAQSMDKNLIVYVNDINEAPTNISLSSNTVDELRPVNSVVGALSATDPDAGATFTYSQACTTPGVDDSSFNIQGTSLRTSAVFNFGIKSTYNICIRVTDQGALSMDKNFAILVNNMEVIYVPLVVKINP
jgi:hypothetical protein